MAAEYDVTKAVADSAVARPRLHLAGTNQGLFNNAAQTWNHNFFWNSIKANGGGKPTGKVAAAIDASFGSYDNFRKEFVTAANTQFGSGWAWLVQDKAGALKVVKTGNADVPVTDGLVRSDQPHPTPCRHRERRHGRVPLLRLQPDVRPCMSLAWCVCRRPSSWLTSGE